MQRLSGCSSACRTFRSSRVKRVCRSLSAGWPPGCPGGQCCKPQRRRLLAVVVGRGASAGSSLLGRVLSLLSGVSCVLSSVGSVVSSSSGARSGSGVSLGSSSVSSSGSGVSAGLSSVGSGCVAGGGGVVSGFLSFASCFSSFSGRIRSLLRVGASSQGQTHGQSQQCLVHRHDGVLEYVEFNAHGCARCRHHDKAVNAVKMFGRFFFLLRLGRFSRT